MKWVIPSLLSLFSLIATPFQGPARESAAPKGVSLATAQATFVRFDENEDGVWGPREALQIGIDARRFGLSDFDENHLWSWEEFVVGFCELQDAGGRPVASDLRNEVDPIRRQWNVDRKRRGEEERSTHAPTRGAASPRAGQGPRPPVGGSPVGSQGGRRKGKIIDERARERMAELRARQAAGGADETVIQAERDAVMSRATKAKSRKRGGKQATAQVEEPAPPSIDPAKNISLEARSREIERRADQAHAGIRDRIREAGAGRAAETELAREDLSQRVSRVIQDQRATRAEYASGAAEGEPGQAPSPEAGERSRRAQGSNPADAARRALEAQESLGQRLRRQTGDQRSRKERLREAEEQIQAEKEEARAGASAEQPEAEEVADAPGSKRVAPRATGKNAQGRPAGAQRNSPRKKPAARKPAARKPTAGKPAKRASKGGGGHPTVKKARGKSGARSRRGGKSKGKRRGR